MPLGFTRHSNRSQQLASPQAQRTLPIVEQQQQDQHHQQPVVVTGAKDKAHDPSYTQPQPQSYSKIPNDAEQYVPTPLDQQAANSAYHELSTHADAPSRSQSHRFSTTYFNIAGPQPQPSNRSNPALGVANEPPPVPEPVPGELRKSSTIGPGSKAQLLSVDVHKKSKSRSFFHPFSSKSQRAQEQTNQQASPKNVAALGRRVSKKGPDTTAILPSQQNNSIERLQQQADWQSSQSSGTSSLPQDQENDGLDPYLIREEGAEQSPATAYDPRLGLSVRVVGDTHVPQQYPQYQDQQQLHSPQQYSPQQYQTVSQHNTPISVDQPLEYTSQMNLQQSVQYQQQQQQTQPQPQPQQNPGNFGAQGQQYRTQNSEVVSQISHDSPSDQVEEARPPSVQSSQGYGAQQYSSRIATQEPRALPQQQSSMAPPSQAAAQSRKSTDTSKAMQGDGRGPPSGYSQGQFPVPNQGPPNLQNPLPPIPGQQPAGYRNSQLQREYGQSGPGEGRSTPPPPEARELNDMEKLLIKYKKVKNLYFEKQAQVEQLQNTLANQRLSQSRTSLDDSEYITRFQRLDGAIKEVAFSIRKDWKVIPHWLAPFVNTDALKTGKEMTAVGRATISRWLADEIFGKCFHPGLDIELSTELKRIEQNVRFFAPPATSQEDAEALTAKILQWRQATMEGLAYRLNTSHSNQAKADFTQMAVSNLTAHLLNHLQDTSSHNIQGNATSIVELAVGIASHLPLESRDIVIGYPLPADAVQPFMRIEQALPALDLALLESSEGGASAAAEAKDEDSKSSSKGKKLEKSSKLAPGNAKKAAADAGEPSAELKKEGANKIRFAGFVGVEVRGRQWLYNPPVWTIS